MRVRPSRSIAPHRGAPLPAAQGVDRQSGHPGQGDDRGADGPNATGAVLPISDSPAIESLTTSNSPVLTVMSYTNIAMSTIQPIGNNPNSAPLTRAAVAIGAGIPYTSSATSRAVANPARAAKYARTRTSPSSPSRTMTGSAATRADRARLSATGSYRWFQTANITAGRPSEAAASPRS